MKVLVVFVLVLSLLLLPTVGSASSAEAETEPTDAESVLASEEPPTLEDAVAAVELAGSASGPSGDVVVIILGDPITVVGTGAVVSGNTVTIIAGGTYRATGALADGMIEVNTDGEVELILDSVDITHSDGPAIKVANAARLSLVLADGSSNTLVDGATYSESGVKGALFSNDTLEISGTGALAITGNFKHGIACDDDLIITGGEITIAAATDGIHANDYITVSGGTIQIMQANDGIESEGFLLVEGGALTLTADDDAIIGADTLTVNGGTIDVVAAVDGVESKNNVIVNDGAITVAASGTGLKGANDITINGGRIYVDAAGDALYSGGTLNMNGGVVVALGGDAPESGLVCETCAINGGTLMSTGGTNSTPVDTSMQNVVVMGGMTAGSAIHIDGSGDDVLIFKASKSFGSMVFSSQDLISGGPYTAYSGGDVSGGADFHGLYTGAAYSGGNVWEVFTVDSVVTFAVGTLPWRFHYPFGAYAAG